MLTHETRPFSVTLHFTADAKIADTWQFANMPLISSSIYSHTQKSYYYFYAKKLSVPASYLLENIFAGEVSSYPEKPALGVPLYTNQWWQKSEDCDGAYCTVLEVGVSNNPQVQRYK